MSDNENYTKILEKISEVRENVGVLTNETQHIKTDLSEVRREISNIKDQDIQQNKLLDEHIRGVATANRRLDIEIAARTENRGLIVRQLEDLDTRLREAEKFPNAVHSMKKFLQWLAGILVAAVALAEYLRGR